MKIGIIGTGYIAGRHATVLSGRSDVDIAGHVDVVPEGAQKAAAQYGGKAYTSIHDLLKNQKLDAAWVCTPPFAHGEVEDALIKAGVHFYVEKPLSSGLDEPRRIAAALKNTGIITSAGYYWRCTEVTTRLRQMLAETPPRLIRAAWHGLTPPVPWWRKEAKSGGQIVEQATHLFDLARHVAGEAKVEFAAAQRFDMPAYPDADVANVSAATLRFENGAIGVFTATSVIHATVDASIEFFCDGRKLTLTNKALVIEDANGRQEIPWGRDPLAIADDLFIEAIQKQDPSLVACSYEDALKTQELCCEARDKAKAKETTV